MAFSIFFSATVILADAYLSVKKNLHPFEMLFIWMVTVLIHHNFFTIIALNMKLIDYANDSAHYWTLIWMRVFLIPLLIIVYFDRMVVRRSYQKWLWLPPGILLLIGLEYACELLGVCKLSGWKMWWSMIEWLGIFLLIDFSWLCYRSLLRKEMKRDDSASSRAV